MYALWPWLPFLGRVAKPHTIIFFGFSILGEAMNQGIFPAFQNQWKETTGEEVEFISSFAGSGTVANQFIMGAPAHLALLSLESDAQRLSDAGVVEPQCWRRLPYRGVVNRTPFVILVRPGNPKSIHDYNDLTRPGIGVVHPDPLTSGGAKWAIVAEYGAGARNRPAESQAGYDILLGIWRNVIAQAHSARAGGRLARRLGASATLLHVAAETGEIAPLARAHTGEIAPLARAHIERAASTLRTFDAPVEARIRQDRSIAGGILAEARAGGHDIIVIGRREPSPLSMFGIDEITRQVLSESDRPVLFVPGRED